MIGMFDHKDYEELPAVPERLHFLWAEHNRLSKIPVLPELKLLNISYNQFTEVPFLSPTLTSFNCDGNRIKELPALPETLTFLSCLDNPILTLPTLPPQLKTMYISEPTSLPTLPATLTNFIVHSVKRLDDPSFIRLIDNLPNTGYKVLVTQIMWRDVTSIAVLKRMLRSDYFKGYKVMERIIHAVTIKTNLRQLLQEDMITLILGY